MVHNHLKKELKVHQLILIRHGQSIWNKENRFTGWMNIDLSEKGKQEAKEAAQLLLDGHFHFDTLFTSELIRAQNTARIIQEQMGTSLTPISSWKLNERHYGGLTGLNKEETTQKHGAEQVKTWRRSYDTLPPKMDETQAQNLSRELDVPLCYGESLKTTVERVIPYWKEEIAPLVRQDQKVLIVAHGNSLRALMKYIFEISNDDIIQLEIPTATPVICELDDSLKGTDYRFLQK